MFNRALSIKLVKTTPTHEGVEPIVKAVDASDLAEIVMYHASHAAKIVASVYAGRKVLNTACEIAIIAAQKRL